MKTTFILFISALLWIGCAKSDGEGERSPFDTSPGTVTDINGHVYPTVVIGTQRWMAEDLRTSRYRDGSSIPYVPDNSEWTGQDSGAYAMYADITVIDSTEGKLYNWFALIDPRGLCPNGWHAPTDADWRILESSLGMPSAELAVGGFRGTAQNVGGQLKVAGLGPGLWAAPNTGATNSSGFSGMPIGIRSGTEGWYAARLEYGNWWTATESGAATAWARSLHYSEAGVLNQDHLQKTYGLCVRCVVD